MTIERPDLYAILGVAPDATQAQISHAFRALVRRYHPDTRATDDGQDVASEAPLHQVIAAYTVLRDPARRADYDQQAGPRPRPAHQPPPRAVNQRGAYGRPPIVAGPVRWHRS